MMKLVVFSQIFDPVLCLFLKACWPRDIRNLEKSVYTDVNDLFIKKSKRSSNVYQVYSQKVCLLSCERLHSKRYDFFNEKMVSNHYLERTAMRKYMLLIEKTLSFEKYKTRTMRPNGFLGRGLLALQIHIFFCYMSLHYQEFLSPIHSNKVQKDLSFLGDKPTNSLLGTCFFRDLSSYREYIV